MLSRRLIAAVAGLASHVAAQTPMDFEPGSLVNLGVSYPGFEIDPPGTLAPSLDLLKTVPQLMIPASQLVGPTGQVDPTKKYMVFMIDTDVVQAGVATTVLHWFQPDLTAQGGSLVLTGNSSSVLLTVDPNSTFNPTTASTKRQAPPLPPAPAPNPDNIDPGAFGERAQALYLPPSPPPGPPHRYVQVVFAQPSNFTFPVCFQNVLSQPTTTGTSGDRLGFDINEFLQAANIRTRPIAGNYLRAQNPQPGALSVAAATTSLKNNNCPGVTPAPSAPAAIGLRFRRI